MFKLGLKKDKDDKKPKPEVQQAPAEPEPRRPGIVPLQVQQPAKKKRKEKKEKSQVSPIFAYSYTLAGARVTFLLPMLFGLEARLKQAMMPVPFEVYVAGMAVLSVIAGIVGAVIGFIGARVVDIEPAAVANLLPFIAGLLAFQGTFWAMYFLPAINVGTRRRMLGEELPYYTGYMAMLASSGMGLEGIFRAIALEGTKEEIVKDANFMMRNIEVLGMDIVTALNDLVSRSPVGPYVELLEGLIATVHAGGDLRSYFAATGKVQLEEKRLLLKKMTASLGVVAEMYTILLVVFPLLTVIILSIMAIMTPTIAGFSLIFLMNLLTFGFVPMVGMMMLLMIDAMLPKR